MLDLFIHLQMLKGYSLSLDQKENSGYFFWERGKEGGGGTVQCNMVQIQMRINLR